MADGLFCVFNAARPPMSRPIIRSRLGLSVRTECQVASDIIGSELQEPLAGECPVDIDGLLIVDECHEVAKVRIIISGNAHFDASCSILQHLFFYEMSFGGNDKAVWVDAFSSLTHPPTNNIAKSTLTKRRVYFSTYARISIEKEDTCVRK